MRGANTVFFVCAFVEWKSTMWILQKRSNSNRTHVRSFVRSLTHSHRHNNTCNPFVWVVDLVNFIYFHTFIIEEKVTPSSSALLMANCRHESKNVRKEWEKSKQLLTVRYGCRRINLLPSAKKSARQPGSFFAYLCVCVLLNEIPVGISHSIQTLTIVPTFFHSQWHAFALSLFLFGTRTPWTKQQHSSKITQRRICTNSMANTLSLCQ